MWYKLWLHNHNSLESVIIKECSNLKELQEIMLNLDMVVGMDYTSNIETITEICDE